MTTEKGKRAAYTLEYKVKVNTATKYPESSIEHNLHHG
jgi:hypothetical protein